LKVVILAGGFGTRISEESALRPKPMIEIGERPILWHIMKHYSHHGFDDFVICLGYKGYCIKEYFAHYYLHESDVTFDFRKGNDRVVHAHTAEPWRVTLVDTGLETMTGGRVKRIAPYVGNSTFLLTYGDGVADVDLGRVVEHHRSVGKLATVTAAQPGGRFGALDLAEDGTVRAFREKQASDGGWVNAGFFVMEPGVFRYIEGDGTFLEREPLEGLAREGQLSAYRHGGFWQPMDTLRDKTLLESLWRSGKAPWKVWP
jgi:glucose-1-phosphate cytidylyltransferase